MIKTLFKQLLIILISFSIILMPATYCFAENIEYDFSDEAQEIFDKSETTEVQKTKIEKTVEQPKKQKSPKNKKNVIKPIKVKKGTDFAIALQTSINTESLTEKATVAASLEDDIIYNSNFIAPQGSIVYGKIQKVKSARRFYGNGFIKLTFNEIMLPNGEKLKFSGNIIQIRSRGNRALKVGGDLFLGILGGAVVSMGILPMAAPVGAAIGLLVGTVSAADTQGQNFEIPAGTSFTIRLIKPLKTIPYA